MELVISTGIPWNQCAKTGFPPTQTCSESLISLGKNNGWASPGFPPARLPENTWGRAVFCHIIVFPGNSTISSWNSGEDHEFLLTSCETSSRRPRFPARPHMPRIIDIPKGKAMIPLVWGAPRGRFSRSHTEFLRPRMDSRSNLVAPARFGLGSVGFPWNL